MDLLEDPPDQNHPLNTPDGLFFEAIHHSKYTVRDQRRYVKLLYDERAIQWLKLLTNKELQALSSLFYPSSSYPAETLRKTRRSYF